MASSEKKYPEMKSALEIYIETNYSFIMEKLYSRFRTEVVKDHELKDLEVEKLIDLTNEIFKFGKHNEDMKSFYEQMEPNIQKFIDEKYRNTDETQDLFLSTDLLMEMIKFCVSNGFQPLPQEQVIEEEIQISKESPVPVKKQAQKESKPKKFIIPKPKTPQIKNFIQKHQMPNRKPPARYLQNIPKVIKKPDVEEKEEAEPIDFDFLEKNKQVIDKRLQKLYQHYCSQQQNLGSNATFDKILSECNHMTIGKFMLFCNTTEIFKNSSISKALLQSKFKQISDGKKQIDFIQFKQLLKSLDEVFVENRKKIQNQDFKIPSLEARLFLNSLNFKKMKKDVDLPFTTREKQGRELKKYQYNTLDASSPQRKSLQPTVHSGKFSKNLREYLTTKQELSEEHKKSKMPRREGSQLKNKIIRLDNMGKYNWPGMEWAIIDDDEEDPLIDSVLMKDHRGKHVAGQARKRVSQVQKMQEANNKYSRYS